MMDTPVLNKDVEGAVTTKLNELTDEEAINLIAYLTGSRVTLGVGYLTNNDKTILTHSFITMTAGDVEVMSEPSPLAVPFIPIDFIPPSDPKEIN